MKTSLNIKTPTAIYNGVIWPEGVPFPTVGDEVMLRLMNQTWKFQVTNRHLSVGTDMRGNPGATVLLTVSENVPEGVHLPHGQP